MSPIARSWPLVFALVACVGDDSNVPVDASTDTGTGSDATVDAPTDAAPPVEAAVDAGPTRTGAFQWLYTLPAVSDFGMATAADGSTAFATTFTGTITIDSTQITAAASGTDILVAELDATGKLKWYKHYGNVDADVTVNAVTISGNTVIVVGNYQPQDTSNLSWTPIPYNTITSDGSGNNGPFVMGFDGTQGGAMIWAKSVVKPNAGEGSCDALSSSVAGSVEIACSVSGSVVVTMQSTAPETDTLGGELVANIRAADGIASDWEVIEGTYGDSAVGLDPDGNAYFSGDVVATPLKFRRANTTVAFDASSLHNALIRMQAGGGALWTRFWPSTLDPNPETAPRIAFDSSKNPWVAVAFQGSVDPGGGTLTSAGLTDWAVVGLHTDGSVVTEKAFGGVAADHVFDVAFDDGDLVLFGDGASFSLGGLAVPSAPGSSTHLALAKFDQTTLTGGVWLDTATESTAWLDWYNSKMSIGGGLDVIGGVSQTEIDFTSTVSVSGNGTTPTLFVAAFAK